MDIIDALILIAAGFFTGFINTVAGGGSLISLPVLIFMGLPVPVANATNRVALFSQNIFGIAGFKSKGISAFPYSLYLGLSALVGAAIGAELSVELPEELFKRIIAIIMVLVVLSTVFNPVKTGALVERLGKKHTIYGLITFFFIGIYGGFIQVGVGFVIMAALTHINHFSLVKTNSAKVFIVLVYTVSALVVFIIEDMINWYYGLVLAIGNSAGAWIASRYSVKKGDKWIKRFLLVMACILAIKLWFFDTV
ncbi:MAG: sulfite exporter TauE/SafE family protein [Cyclobacteriaceae bacterium]|nr:sulfite exporter TauE/SafE family protein [Cyclobacteriaceae bacterium]